MVRKLQIIALFSAVSLLILCPGTSFAWHDYYGGYGDWYYHGSGRDLPYSYVIDQTSPGYADYSYVEPPDYLDAASYYNHAPAPAPQPQPDTFTVNIPNGHGGYIPVVIKRSGTGYVGPQGEFYPEFPKVFQLQIMYGK